LIGSVHWRKISALVLGIYQTGLGISRATGAVSRWQWRG
jgi:hypothetical protein